MNPLVSIIMPAKDVADYIKEAIDSVIQQDYEGWELIVVENGSTDNTWEIISSYTDPRIKSMQSSVVGLSHARNVGLSKALGEFFCFLDADDLLPSRSLSSRIAVMQHNPEVCFVDGLVTTVSQNLKHTIRAWSPSFRGIPQVEMARLNPRCFSAITWLIRKTPDMNLSFDESWTHLEDRVYFLSIAHAGRYEFVQNEVYTVRRRRFSLMSNIDALEKAYLRFMDYISTKNLLSQAELQSERKFLHAVFAKTYAKHFKLQSALKHFRAYLSS